MHRTVSSIGGFAARRAGAVQWSTVRGRQRAFHASARRDIVKPFLLADIGEGIKEVQIIQWFVQPGARVEQFDKICEVQSDKASVDITSRFDGVIKKLHYEADAMAQVGKPLLDIDITGDINPSDEKLLDDSSGSAEGSASAQSSESTAPSSTNSSTDKPASSPPSSSTGPPQARSLGSAKSSSSNLATPAVRGLLKEMNLDISEIQGTGKDGRVLKEDVHAHVAAQKSGAGRADTSTTTSASAAPAFSRPAVAAGAQQETSQNLSPIQSAMFKSMTKSLTIPHFLCADEVDLTALTTLRQQVNATSSSNEPKLSALAFIIKAMSLALDEYPILNARVDTANGSPKLVYRTQHNIGVAMDTPQGLLVPNVKSVNAKSVREIANELLRLQGLAGQGKLSNADLRGGTITVSNIGSIGGSYATPLLVEGEVAILATGRARRTPRFDDTGRVEARDVAAFSWSADHRVVDGATLARAAGVVKEWLEQPARMVVALR